MKMNITDEQLHELIPHVIATVEGEPTLVEKLQSFLEEAELWSEQNFLSDEVELTPALEPYAQKVVAYHLCRSLNINVHLWQNFQSLHARLIKIESVLAETYFSHEQMQSLRASALAQMRNTSPLEEQVIRTLQSFELQLLTDIQVHPQCYYDLVTIIRSHPAEFPAWHSSPVAELYTPKIFENKKKSGGYWF